MKDQMVVTEIAAASYMKNNEGGLMKHLDLNANGSNSSSGGGGGVVTDLSLGLSVTSSSRHNRIGRPPGTGWKQQLSLFGEWMANSAGKAFMPHAIYVDEGEDVATKIRSFVKKRKRAICILSACGSVSEVTLKLSRSSKVPVTYEGHFDIVCLSGSYLPAKSGRRRNGTGGVSISLSDPVGQVVGGAIGGKLIAATPVQVIAFTFKYDGNQKNKQEAPTKTEISSNVNSSVQVMSANTQGLTGSSTSVSPLFLC